MRSSGHAGVIPRLPGSIFLHEFGPFISMTGTPCPRCKTGWLVVYATKRTSARTTRYFACWACHHRPEANKTVGKPKDRTRNRRRVRTS